MLWVKAFHIFFVIAWFAGFLYLPRLFVYHSLAEDEVSKERFKIMERKLLRGIMTPSALVTLVLGTILLVSLWPAYKHAGWIYAKLALVVGLMVYHMWCAKLVREFREDRNRHSHIWYRWFNEIPAVILIVILILVVVKPF